MPGAGARVFRPYKRSMETDITGQPVLTVDACCSGALGSISIDANGDFIWNPFQEPKPASMCPEPCLRAPYSQQIVPARDMVGARMEQDGALRVWYCDAVRSKAPGGLPKVQYKLKKSSRFECSTQEDAKKLVVQLQKQSSWWGRARPQHIVVISNPKSGKSRAGSVVSGTLLPMLREAAGLRVTVHETLSRGHATQVVSELDLSDVDMVVYVGGDGTVFEGLQGLLNRPDWNSARQVPFAHVPGGSGNGLAASCGLWDPVTAAFAICKGRTQPLDVASVLQPPGSRFFVFLSVVFGLWANIDIGTEAHRWMGDSRYTLKGVQEALRTATYPARIAFWPADVPSPQAAPPVVPVLPVHPLETTMPPDSTSNGTTSAATSWVKAPEAPAMEEHVHHVGLPVSAAEAPELQQALLLNECSSSDVAGTSGRGSGAGNGRTSRGLEHAGLAAAAAAAAVPGSSGANGGDRQQLLGFPAGPPLPLLSSSWPDGQLPAGLPSSQHGLPPGWQLLPETQLQMMAMYNVPYMATHARLNPKGALHSGSFDLLYMHGLSGLSGTLAYADMLIRSEEGGHVDLDCVQSEKVKAMVLQPLCDDSYMVLDGEEVPRRPVYAEVHPGLCSVCVAPEFRE